MMTQPDLMKPPPRGPPETDGTHPQEPPKSKIPVLEKHLVDQLSTEEISSLSSKFQEAADAEKKAHLKFFCPSFIGLFFSDQLVPVVFTHS
jgi:hypothetical protein